MKYKKYILILLLVIFIGWNRVEATDNAICYYKSDNLSAYVNFVWDEDISDIKTEIELAGKVRVLSYDGQAINKSGNVRNITPYEWNPLDWFKGIVYPAYQVNVTEIKKNYQKCPKYIVVKKGNWNTAITDDSSLAVKGFEINNFNYAQSVSANEFWNYSLCNGKDCIIGEDIIINCDNNELFGDPEEAGGYLDINGNEVPPSLAYIINKVLTYIRILVPIVIILLGSFDLAKAVIAGKPDEMKKSQSTFFKRIIAGICVFLAPVFVNLLMSFADMAWEGSGYEICKPEVILKK